MPHIVKRDNIVVDDNPRRSVWKMINPTTVPLDIGASGGVVAYKHIENSDDTPHTHCDPAAEFFYVMDGEGTLSYDGEEVKIRKGDAFAIPAGIDHAMWSDHANAPLLAFYVEMHPQT